MGLLAIKSAVRKVAETPLKVNASIEAVSTQPRGEPQAGRATETAALLTSPPPDPARAGLVQWEEGGPFLHYCECGAWGVFGYGVDAKVGRLGRWYCREHNPEPRG